MNTEPEPPRRIQRLSSALQKEIELQLDAGMPPAEIAAILTELAIRYAYDDQLTAHATLTRVAEAVQDALEKARS